MNGICDVKRCRETAELGYLEHEVCWRHWSLHCDDTKPFNLKGALGIKERNASPKEKPKAIMAKRKVKHISRGRLLTKREAAKYNRIRAAVDAEKPRIKARIRSKSEEMPGKNLL